jgi:hypothetical protein
MKWYLAKLVYRIICGNGNHTAQFDEQLRLIGAANSKQAIEKAASLGKQEAETFVNEQQEMVQWQFIDVSELFLINELSHGAELYSRIQEADNANDFIATVHRKATNLLINTVLFTP